MAVSPSNDRRRVPSFLQWEARDLAPLVSLAVLVLFFCWASPSFWKPVTAKQILQQGSALAIVSFGLTYVLLCAEIDLSVGMVALWSACLCGWLWQNWPSLLEQLTGTLPAEPAMAPFWMLCLVLFVPVFSGTLLGLLSGGLTVWSRLPSFIITLAMMYIAQGSARYLTKSETLDVPEVLKTLGNRGIDVTDRFMLPYSALLVLGVFIVGHIVLIHTRFGRYVYMTGGNREAARLAGVRTGRIVVACLAISALTAAVGGLVNAGRLNSVSLDQNADLLLSAVACVVLGGTSLFGGEGSLFKTAIGVCTFTVLSIGLVQIQWVDDLARQLLMGVVLMVALVINGLLAKRSYSSPRG